MKVVSLLADAAQVDQQTKVHALGINWTHMPSPPLPMAIIVLTEVSPDEMPAALSIVIELLDSGGQPVSLPQPPDGQPKPLRIEGVGTASPREGGNEWEPTTVPFVAQVGPGLPLEPGNYKFAIRIHSARGGSQSDELRFRIRQPGT